MPSSVISAFRYETGSQTLVIRFVGGRVYRYADVPQNVSEAFAHAPSKGRFFNARIKDRYHFEQTI